jgi:hypothetical protein
MPRIPILPPLEAMSGGAGTGDSPAPLPPEAADGLRRLEARTARIDQGLAVSQNWLSAVDRLAQASDAPEGPSPGFTRSFLDETDRDRAAALDTFPPDRRGWLDQDLLGLRADFADRAAAVEADGLALRRRLGLYRTLDGYRTGLTKDPGLYDDAAGRMAGLVADLDLPEDRHRALDLHVKDALGNAAVDGLMGEPARAVRMLSAGLFDDVLSQASKAARMKQAQALVARQRLLDRERTLSDLTAQAGDGTASESTIAAAAKSGVLTDAETEQLRTRNAEAAQASAAREANIRRVASSSGPLDPADPEDRAAVGDYWDRVSGAYAQDDAAAQRKAELGFVQRTGVLPDGLRRKYQGALLSADPAVAVSGAQAITKLAAMDPALVVGIPADQRQRADAIAQYAQLDLPPERSMELAEKDVRKGNGRSSKRAKLAEFEVAVADEPSVTSDAAATGAPDENAAGPDQSSDSGGLQPDGSAVLIDPEIGERTTVGPADAERLHALARDHLALLELHKTFLDSYDRVAAGETTREEATRRLLASIDEALPATNEVGSPIAADMTLRQTLQRLATDIFDESDRADIDNIFTDAVVTPGRIQEIGTLILSFLPVTGEIISARDAYTGFAAAVAAARNGEKGQALREGGWASLSTLGAIPLIGYLPRIGRGSVKAFQAVRRFLLGRARTGDEVARDVANAADNIKRGGPATHAESVDPTREYVRESPGEELVGELNFSWYHRSRWTTNRTLKKKWAEHHGVKWPKDPKTGHDMDVHHVIPLADRGPDHFLNIVPIPHDEHVRLHQENNDFARWRERRGKQ